MPRLVMLGRQGSGKGTQCERLAEHCAIPHISTGEILRAAVAAQTDLGQRAKATMDAGDLVPDEIMLGIIEERLAQRDAANGFLLDGFPRTDAQAQGLDELLGEDRLGLVVNLDVPDEVVIERMLARGRADDTEEAIRRRLALYEEETAPLLEWYRRQGLLATVDGVGTPDEVFARLEDVVTQRTQAP
jgi:adenylate kinase